MTWKIVKQAACRHLDLTSIARRTCLLITVVLLACCSSEADQQRRILQQMRSWIASAEMIAHARVEGLIPTMFSGPALRRCNIEISSLADDLKNAQLSAAQRTALANLSTLLAEAEGASSRKDGPQTERVILALRRTRGSLDPAGKIP